MQSVVIAVLVAAAALPNGACAQDELADPERSERAGTEETSPEIERELPRLVVSTEVRTLGDRYEDALAGTWAAAGIGLAAGSLLGAMVGALLGCGYAPACFGITLAGLGIGAAAGWLLGTGIGATVGAGLGPLEGLGALGLGLLCAVATVFAFILGAGAGLNEWLWGFGLGGTVGGLTLAFMTPLFAAMLAEDPRPGLSRPALDGSVAPAVGGLSLRIGGRF